MAVEYSDAPEIRKIAQRLIKAHHPELVTSEVRIDYVWRSQASSKGGVVARGAARKITGLHAHLAGSPGPFFVIEIARDEWDVLGKPARDALVDHELMHCGVTVDDETGEWKAVLQEHDIEEFVDVVRRHGITTEEQKAFGSAAAHQLSLLE
jgi:predicted metallopeptidase